MAEMIQLTLNNGEVVDLELGYNPFKCMLIAKSFPEVNQVFTVAVQEGTQELNYTTLASAVYVAYRQANLKKGLTFEEFYGEDGWSFEIEKAAMIYTSMLDNNTAKEYAKKMAKLGKSKKKGK